MMEYIFGGRKVMVRAQNFIFKMAGIPRMILTADDLLGRATPRTAGNA